MENLAGLAALILQYGKRKGCIYECFIPDTAFQSIPPDTATLEQERTENGIIIRLNLNVTIQGNPQPPCACGTPGCTDIPELTEEQLKSAKRREETPENPEKKIEGRD